MNDATLSQLSTLTLPEPLYLVGLMLFGFIGYFAYKQGKKSGTAAAQMGGHRLSTLPLCGG
jgi:hypothetical protein